MDRLPGESSTTRLPHRDPETGQFLSEAESIDFDDVLRIETGSQFSDADAQGDIIAQSTLTYQRDYRVKAIAVGATMMPKALHDKLGDPPGAANDARAQYQLATTGTFATADSEEDGGTIPPGVAHMDTLDCFLPVAFDDDASAGGIGGGTEDRHRHFLSGPYLHNFDTSPDAGSTITARVKLTRVPQVAGARGEVHTTYDLYVKERDE